MTRKLSKVPRLPVPDPRDSHLHPTAETKHWVDFLLEQRESMRTNKWAWFDGHQTQQVLRHVFNASDEDFEAFENASDNMNHDPIFAFRKRNMYRLTLDLNLGTARRLSRVPYVLSETDGLVSHMTGMHRFYGETQDWVMQNSVFQVHML